MKIQLLLLFCTKTGVMKLNYDLHDLLEKNDGN